MCRSVPALRTCSRQIEPPAGQLEDFAALASFSSRRRDRAANRRFCLASPPPSSAASSILLMLRRPPPHFLPPALLKDSRLNKSDLYRSIFAPICRQLNTLFTLVLGVCATNSPAYLCFVLFVLLFSLCSFNLPVSASSNHSQFTNIHSFRTQLYILKSVKLIPETL